MYYLFLRIFARFMDALWKDEKKSEDYKQKSAELRKEIKAMEEEYLKS